MRVLLSSWNNAAARRVPATGGHESPLTAPETQPWPRTQSTPPKRSSASSATTPQDFVTAPIADRQSRRYIAGN